MSTPDAASTSYRLKPSAHRWHKLTWVTPLAYTTVTFIFGMVFPRLEHHYLPELASTISVSSAMAIGSAIASGMIALTGIVFSLAFVMVQFSATAYSPRLVLWVARDPVVSHAMGVFIATFLYALMLMAWIDREASGHVPLISGWLVIGLLAASMAMFIALIERIGSLQVNRMLIFTGDQGRKAIKELYPSEGLRAARVETEIVERKPVTQTLVHTGRPLVIQAVEIGALIAQAREADAVIEMLSAVGDTVMELTPLLRVRGARQPLAERTLAESIEAGDERTFRQDPKYAIRLLVDIAIKALSPAVNDPTTAVQALDQIEDLLLRLGRRDLDIRAFHDDAGRLRLVVPFPTWDDFLLLALDEIRAYGASSVQVMRRMMALIKNLTEVLPAARTPALQRWERRLQSTIARSFADLDEKKDAAVADRQGLGIGEENSSRVVQPAARRALLVPCSVFDDDVDALQKRDVAQHVAADGDDVRILARRDRADVPIDFHRHRRPVGRGANSRHRIDAEDIHPGIELAPRRLAVELHRDAAVGADQHDDAGVAQLLELRASVGRRAGVSWKYGSRSGCWMDLRMSAMISGGSPSCHDVSSRASGLSRRDS